MNSSVAKRTRAGASLSKMVGGVQRSSNAPIIPPAKLGAMRIRKCDSPARSSRRKPQAPPTEPGQVATVLVALAITEGRPIQTSVGKEIRVPPPAMELIAPARKAATAAALACARSIELLQNAQNGRPR